MFNKSILIGRLCADPALRYTPNGAAVCNFTLAINRKFNREETDFIDIVVWQKLAENCANYLHKGSMACVEGRIQVRSYETQEGQKRKVTEVVADDVRFLDSKKSGESRPQTQQAQKDDWSDLGQEVNLEDIDLTGNGGEIPF